MKKAVIAAGGKQYVVTEGAEISVERVAGDTKTVKYEALLVIDGDKVTVGAPVVAGTAVTATVLSEMKDEKVTAIRYKAKKRVKKVHGHRQIKTQLKIEKIA